MVFPEPTHIQRKISPLEIWIFVHTSGIVLFWTYVYFCTANTWYRTFVCVRQLCGIVVYGSWFLPNCNKVIIGDGNNVFSIWWECDFVHYYVFGCASIIGIIILYDWPGHNTFIAFWFIQCTIREERYSPKGAILIGQCELTFSSFSSLSVVIQDGSL